eukprot:Gregarina_sp_Poly_1__7557@NODE_422_length_8655_cov_206_021076_g344_i0_p8_GENE_NODE_422_length_8655_cov_206_021076_g344_i0NODE_422_length_8655_cov_206_021076_g344_i0_p8_ORF_typecomplete_len149_score0_02Chitin_bind_1/PF00187_19/1_8e04Chitin_bind_1/PF00187_19/0_18_NODE_422_length_8655_cov_206_021076_g344_i0238684
MRHSYWHFNLHSEYLSKIAASLRFHSSIRCSSHGRNDLIWGRGYIGTRHGYMDYFGVPWSQSGFCGTTFRFIPVFASTGVYDSLVSGCQSLDTISGSVRDFLHPMGFIASGALYRPSEIRIEYRPESLLSSLDGTSPGTDPPYCYVFS